MTGSARLVPYPVPGQCGSDRELVAVTQRERLVARIRARPPEADLGDVRRLLEEFGWRLARQRGSHVTFTKEGEYPIVVPQHHGRKVKRVYLARICERLGLDE